MDLRDRLVDPPFTVEHVVRILDAIKYDNLGKVNVVMLLRDLVEDPGNWQQIVQCLECGNSRQILRTHLGVSSGSASNYSGSASMPVCTSVPAQPDGALLTLTVVGAGQCDEDDLLRALDSYNGTVLVHLCKSLHQRGESMDLHLAIRVFTDMARTNELWWRRRNAVQALMYLKDFAAQADTIQALRLVLVYDSRREVRGAAVRALVVLGRDALGSAQRDLEYVAAEDDSMWIRELACKTLKTIKEQSH